MASNNNKRRRTAADTLHISELPVDILADVSAYLSKPSRAILAVAFSEPSSSVKNNDYQPSPISTAIVSAQQWDILDFEDVEKELANIFTDDDISAVLKCINAQDVLKRLKLCGCVNITGIGLNPLKGSTVLEQIDISLVGRHENHFEVIESKISKVVIISILDSIISTDGCSLKSIMFPKKWHGGSIPLLMEFRDRYNRSFDKRRLSCTRCNMAIPTEDVAINTADASWMGYYYYQNKVCHDCLKPFCEKRQCIADNGSSFLKFCNHCGKDYCNGCSPFAMCAGCDTGTVCGSCSEKCSRCDKTWCKECPNVFRCVCCNKTVCTECSSYEGECPSDEFACADCMRGSAIGRQ